MALSVATRIALAVAMARLPGAAGMVLALTLAGNQVPDGGWIALELAVGGLGNSRVAGTGPAR